MARKSYDERLEAFKSQKEDIQTHIERQSLKHENFSELVLNYQEEIKKIEEDLETLEKENFNKASELKDRENFLSEIKNELNDLLQWHERT